MGDRVQKSNLALEEFAAQLNPGTVRVQSAERDIPGAVSPNGEQYRPLGAQQAHTRGVEENHAEDVELGSSSSISTSEAWFVPDPDDVPPEESTPLIYMPPPTSFTTGMPTTTTTTTTLPSTTSSSLPARHISGVRGLVIPPIVPGGDANNSNLNNTFLSPSPLSLSPSSSAWGSQIADLDSASHASTVSTLSTSPSSPSPPPVMTLISPRLRPVLMRPSPGGANWSVAMPHDLSAHPQLGAASTTTSNTSHSSNSHATHYTSPGSSLGNEADRTATLGLSSPRVSAHRASISGASSGYTASASATSSPPHSSSSSSFSVTTSPPQRKPQPIPSSHTKFREALGDDTSTVSSLSSTRSLNVNEHYEDNESDQEPDGEESETSSMGGDAKSASTGDGVMQASGSPSTKTAPITIISPRSMASDGHSSLQLRTSAGGSGAGNQISGVVSPKSTGRIPRTKSVALNPMQVGRINTSAAISASPREGPLSPGGNFGSSSSSSVASSSISSVQPHNNSTQSSSTPIQPGTNTSSSAAPSTFTASSSGSSGRPVSPSASSTHDGVSSYGTLRSSGALNSSGGILDRRTSHSVGLQGLQGLQAIPSPIASALNMPTAPALEMQTGGDVHLSQWAWDSRKKHGFLKVSSDHSSISWSSATNYGLARSNTPLMHKKTFIEIAKTRGVAQLLHVGIAKPSVDWACSPQKLQFNSVTIPGEWSAIWIKNSATGDRLGVLFDLDNFKMTVYKNGLVAYNADIPQTFQVEEKRPEEPSSETDANTDEAAAATSSSAQSEIPLIYPFVGICGDQDILITEMPEFEKYVDITWAHDRVVQLVTPTTTLEGVPAVLESLGLQKLKPKFDGMSMSSFQKLKDVDLRKLGTTPDQRKRLLSQIETMK